MPLLSQYSSLPFCAPRRVGEKSSQVLLVVLFMVLTIQPPKFKRVQGSQALGCHMQVGAPVHGLRLCCPKEVIAEVQQPVPCPALAETLESGNCLQE